MSSDFTKPYPVPTPISAPFWAALNEQKIELQRCRDCNQWIYYPRSRCSACLSANLEWHAVSGAGSLYTFTVTHQPTAPHFADEVPQMLAVVELDEGVRLTSTLTNVEPAQVQVGMRLQPVFAHVDADTTLLRFEPATG